MPRTLTFLPGTMCDQRLWKPVRQRLEPRFSTAYVAIETRGTRPAMLDLLLRTAGPAPLHLVAFSMGGYLAMDFALRHPSRVASLVAVGASAFGLLAAEKAARARVLQLLAIHPYRGMAMRRLQQFVHPSRWAEAGVIDVIRAMDLDLGKQTLVAQLTETSSRESLAPELHALNVPTLLIGADGDTFAPWSTIEEMARLIPQARCAKARDTGHMIPLEQPDWLASEIDRFHTGEIA